MDGVQSSISYLERLASENPKDVQILFRLALLYVTSDSLQKAAAALEKCLAVDPAMYTARFLLACIYSRGGAYNYALRELQKIVDREGDFCFEQIDFKVLGDLRLSLKAWETYELKEKDSANKFFALGFVFFAFYRNDASIAALKKCLALNPFFPLANYVAGLTSLRMGDVSSAWKFLQSEPSSPNSANIFNVLASVCLSQKKFKQAELFCRKALRINPKYLKAMRNMASAYKGLGAYEQAEKILKNIVSVGEPASIDYYLLGELYEVKNAFEEAEKAYGQAVELDPSNAKAAVTLGRFLLKINKLGEAEAYLTKAAAAMPGNAELNLALGNVFQAQKKYQEAALEFNKCLSLDPSDKAALYAFGSSLAALGRISSAVEIFQRGTEEFPDDPDFKISLALAFSNMGKCEAALSELNAALKIIPDDPFANYCLGVLSSASGNYSQSFSAYETSLGLLKKHMFEGFKKGAISLMSGNIAEAEAEFKKAASPELAKSDLEVYGVLGLLSSLSLYKSEESTRARKFNVDYSKIYETSSLALVRAIDSRDGYSSPHSARVSKIARILAEHISLKNKDLLSEDEIAAIETAAFLHDIGKISVSEQILSKRSPLTETEYAYIRNHPIYSESLLRDSGLPLEILPIVRHHHEKFNGKGYPDGLSKDDIPFGAMIVSIADVFEALSSDRPYRQAFSVEKAVSLINKSKGKDFAPGLVAAFLDIVPEISRIIAETT